MSARIRALARKFEPSETEMDTEMLPMPLSLRGRQQPGVVEGLEQRIVGSAARRVLEKERQIYRVFPPVETSCADGAQRETESNRALPNGVPTPRAELSLLHDGTGDERGRSTPRRRSVRDMIGIFDGHGESRNAMLGT